MSYLKLINIRPNFYSYTDKPILNCTVEFSTNNLLNREVYDIDIPVYYIDFEIYQFIMSSRANNKFKESELIDSLFNIKINSAGNTALWNNKNSGLTVDFLYYLKTNKLNTDATLV
jgi:hypothetical protein